MYAFTRRAAAALLASVVGGVAVGQAPPPVAPPVVVAPPPVVAPPAAPEQRPTGIAAKVNAQDILEVAVFRSLRQFPPGERDVARKEIVGHLIDNALIDQYLTAIRITAEPAEIDKMVGELKEELKKSGKDYAKELEAMMLTEAEFRAEVQAQMKWDKFVVQQTNDDVLKKFFDASPALFDGSMVRVRHILLTPGTDAAKIDEAKKTLTAIKQTVEAEAAKAVPATGDPLAKEQARSAKVDELFVEYAKKYSTCPSKASGGDLNFFPRFGAMVEPFANAAFALNPYQMSEAVTTEFGQHLILCTAKKPGTAKKFEQVKEDVRAVYAVRLRDAVIAQSKPKAQIAITPAK